MAHWSKRYSMEWEQKLSDLWASFDETIEEEFLTRMEQLVAELPADRLSDWRERVATLV